MPFDNERGKEIPELIRLKLHQMTTQWTVALEKHLFSYEDIPKNNFDPKKLDQFAD